MINEDFYENLKCTYQGTEDFYEYQTRGNNSAFSFWDGTSFYKSNHTNDGNGHKVMTVVCSACLKDENPLVRGAAKGLEFKSSIYRLTNGTYPCGCSKQRGKTLLQHHDIDDFVGTTRESNKGGVVTVIRCLGGKGNKRKYLLSCSICDKDESLWPVGSLTTTKSNFTQREVNCGCNSRVVWSESQYKVIVGRIAESKDLRFLGWVGEFTNARTTRIYLGCEHHGVSDNTRIDKFVGLEGGCVYCGRALGNFGYFKTRVDEEDTLYLLKSTGEEIFYKIGRSFNFEVRLKQHTCNSGYNFQVVSLVKATHEVVFRKEQQLLLVTKDHHHLPDTIWAGGISECRTPEILNHPDVISTFNLKETSL